VQPGLQLVVGLEEDGLDLVGGLGSGLDRAAPGEQQHAAQATLPGFGYFFTGPQVRIWVAPKAVGRLKDQLRILTRRNWGVSMAYRIDRINRFTTG